MSQDSDVEMTQEDVGQAEEEATAAEAAAQAELNSNEVRRALRETREEMQENRLDFVDPNSNLIEETLAKIENIFRLVTKPSDAVSEVNLVYEIAVLTRERIKNVHCAYRSFNNVEFMDKLKEYMISMSENNRSRSYADTQDENEPEEAEEEEEDDDESDSNDENDENRPEPKPKIKRRTNKRRSANTRTDYALTKQIIQKFGDEVMHYFRVLPRPRFLLGSLEKVDQSLGKTRKVRQQKARNKDPVEVVRTKIKELEANSKDNETNNTVSETERIYDILKKYYARSEGAAICLYTFMINPHSFSRTIENIFYISFLVKDGFAKIYLEDNLPVIVPIQKEFTNKNENQRTQQKKQTENIQSMISLTKPEWQEIIEVFEIETAIIKDAKK